MTKESSRTGIVRAYLIVSGLDYFADMMITVTSVLLLRARGLSGHAVFATIAGVWIAEAIFEVPTGALADIIGRRLSVLASFVIRAVCYSALFLSKSPAVAIAGTVFAAIGGTFYSGALEAWVVDELGEGGDLDRLFSRGRIAENVGLIAGTMLGAFAGRFDLALPQIMAGSGCILGAILAATFMSTRSDDSGALRLGALSEEIRTRSLDIAEGTKRALGSDGVLLGLMIGTAFLCLFRGIPGVQWTASFEALAAGNLLILGAMRAASSLLEIPLLFWILEAQRRGVYERRWVVSSAACVGAACLAAAALGNTSLVRIFAYVCFTLVPGVCMPGIRAAINERIEPANRATILSVASLFNSLFTGAGLLVVSAWVSDLSSVTATWPLAAAGFAVAGLTAGTLAGLRITKSSVAAKMPALAAPVAS